MKGIPAEHELVQFRGGGSGVLFIKPGSFLPTRAEFAEQTQMLIAAGDRPKVLPMELRGRFTADGAKPTAAADAP